MRGYHNTAGVQAIGSIKGKCNWETDRKQSDNIDRGYIYHEYLDFYWFPFIIVNDFE